MAYGTLRIKHPQTGQFNQIARIIRLHSKSELVQQLEKYLEEKGQTVPSKATLFKLLSCMPAANLKVDFVPSQNVYKVSCVFIFFYYYFFIAGDEGCGQHTRIL